VISSAAAYGAYSPKSFRALITPLQNFAKGKYSNTGDGISST